MSYTTFKYANLKIESNQDTQNPIVTVEFSLANTGKREGAEVPQVYVEELHPSVKRPLKELKGFAKVSLNPGEKQRVSIRLDRSAFAHYDPNQHGWVADDGDYKIIVGSSSRDIVLQGECHLARTVIQAD